MTTSSLPSVAPVADAPAAPRKRRRLSFFGRLRRRVAAISGLFGQLRRTGRWWLVPMVVIFLAAAAVLVVVQVIEYAAPFVYTLF